MDEIESIILNGYKPEKIETIVEQVEQPAKLHLNIRKFKDIFKRVGAFLSPQKKRQVKPHSKEEAEKKFAKSKTSDLVDIARFVIGYGVIGGLGLLLPITLLPLNIHPLTDILRGNLFIEIGVIVFGAGSWLYLFFDLKMFVASLNNRGK